MGFIVVNKNCTVNTVYQTDNFSYAVHEYLSIIDSNLKLLVKYNARTETLDFSHLFIVNQLNEYNHKYYPMTVNTYRYDFKTYSLTSSKGDNIPSSALYDHLVDSIKKNAQIICKSTNTVSDNLIPDKVDVEELVKERSDEEQKILQLKAEYTEDTNKLSELLDELNDEKRAHRVKYEKDAEKRRVFESDKKIYFRLKSEIENDDLDENNIPVMFISKYNVFRCMDIEGELDVDNTDIEHEYDVYCYLFDDDGIHIESSLPNSITSIFEDSKRYTPIDEVLDNISSDTSEFMPELVGDF